MTAYRLFFFFHYKPQGKAFSGSMMLLGLRFDIRVLAAVGLILFFITSIFNPFKNKNYKPFILAFVAMLFFIFIISYVSDFYYYDYLKQRLSAFIISFVQDAGISTKMMWQTYPVIKIILALFIVLYVFIWAIKKVFIQIESNTFLPNNKRSNIYTALFIFVAALAIFGRVGQYPLRWSDAFTLSDDFKANAALNPFQSFISTYSFKNNSYDAATVKEVYPIMANYLGVQNKDSLNYTRKYEAVGDTTNAKNIVIVICESFSAYKSSMYGNGLNATPYFNSMCNNGIFFERCFTPAFGTARGVWATLTGIPDVQENKTASRNPLAVNQQTIMNQFSEYEKFYFLGGSTTWANIRGLLTNNIAGLKIYEEENFKASKVDVWGISDKNLFLEASKVFAAQTKPFVSIIQTADNHKPYTIPAEDLNEFKKVDYPKDTLDKYGFDDNAQLNAFRYTDFCFQKFMDAAKKEKYFANTIFVFVGDHGLRGDAKNMFPKSFTAQGILAEHVPLLFYAPSILAAKRIAEPASQLDIFPSVAALTNKRYTNTSLGVNLFDTIIHKKRYAFIADPDMHTIGVVSDSFYCGRNLNTKQINFVSVINDNPIVMNNIMVQKQKDMLAITDAFYHTAKYLLLNNKK
jgi:phosphoglycerol transferase MdoB-like AlkP superfamily enzyme